MTLRPVREVAQGRWRGILPSLGIDARMLSGKQGPCPLCGGRTRFRFDDKEGRGTWICNSTSCGAGDGVALVMAKNGWDFREAARRIEEIAGEAPVAISKQLQTDEQKRAAMKRMWADAVPVVMGDPVDLYLRSRLGNVAIPATIRTLARCRYPDGTHHPAMIAKMAAADGTPVMLHRTYLTRDGLKADVDQSRMTMPGQMPDGSAVRLGPVGPVLGVAEGIENALAASKLFGVPVWSTLNEVMLAKWVPPAGVSQVVVFGDNDRRCVGQQAAFTAARRMWDRDIQARVELPPAADTDWNDVLRQRLQNQRDDHFSARSAA